MSLGESELILNPDLSIYHLNLRPEDIADTVITVGDPDRVPKVSRYFDHIEVKKGRREFITHTGTLNGKRITVLSTGIGTDNIDIVLNELDALVNIDFPTRQPHPNHRSLQIIRLGTSGAIQPDIPVDSFLLSEYAMGFDNLLYYYDSGIPAHQDLEQAFMEHTGWPAHKARPYAVMADPGLTGLLDGEEVIRGFTATTAGFYGPQGRRLRLGLADEELPDKMRSFEWRGLKFTNFEMETAGIYALAGLLGHKAASVNCIIANRYNKKFSSHPETSIARLIRYLLEKLCPSPRV